MLFSPVVLMHILFAVSSEPHLDLPTLVAAIINA